MSEFYRFRSSSALLGQWQELETQTIYFAEPKALNDPMEGYRDILWNGDYVAWINLFKNYLRCLERVFSLLKVGGEGFEIKDEHIPVFAGSEDFPTEIYKSMFNKISEDFTNNELVKRLARELSKRTYPLRRDELVLYLGKIHFIALLSIDKIHHENKLGQAIANENYERLKSYEQQLKQLLDNGLINKIEEIASFEENGHEKMTFLMQTQRTLQSEINLRRRVDGTFDTASRNRMFVLIDFNDRYIAQVERVLFPDWYTACFMTQCTDSSVWGHYGSNHTGACLIFESTEKNGIHSLRLEKITGMSGKGYNFSYVDCQLHPIDYVDGVGETDFFRMLGRLPIPKLNNEWYYFNGEKSICADDMNKDEDAWRENYWTSFYRDITKKTEHWAYEKEFRIILAGTMIDYSDFEKRKLKYEFSTLKGIIFGIKTSIEDKMKMVEIIKRKCKENNRVDFKFYQAFYNSKKKCIDHQPMDLLNAVLTN